MAMAQQQTTQTERKEKEELRNIDPESLYQKSYQSKKDSTIYEEKKMEASLQTEEYHGSKFVPGKRHHASNQEAETRDINEENGDIKKKNKIENSIDKIDMDEAIALSLQNEEEEAGESSQQHFTNAIDIDEAIALSLHAEENDDKILGVENMNADDTSDLKRSRKNLNDTEEMNLAIALSLQEEQNENWGANSSTDAALNQNSSQDCDMEMAIALSLQSEEDEQRGVAINSPSGQKESHQKIEDDDNGYDRKPSANPNHSTVEHGVDSFADTIIKEDSSSQKSEHDNNGNVKKASASNNSSTLDEEESKDTHAAILNVQKRELGDTVENETSLNLSYPKTDGTLDMDAVLAQTLQAEENDEKDFSGIGSSAAHLPNYTESDESLAMALAFMDPSSTDPFPDSDERMAIAQAQEDNKAAMNSSFSGKAWNFVQAVLNVFAAEKANILAKTSSAIRSMEPIGVDDMLFIAERMAEAQAVFDVERKNTFIDIGYHYTQSKNLDQIKTNGLLSKTERSAKGVVSNYNGSSWGDGVYTGNNPHAFSNYGDTGLFVARLKGDSKPAVFGGRGFVGDTALVSEGDFNEMVILCQSFQCVPLLQFQRHSIPNWRDETANESIWSIHCKLQEIVDTFFNGGSNSGLDPKQIPSYWGRPYQGELKCSPYRSEKLERCNGGEGSNETMRILHYSKDNLTCDLSRTFVIVYAFLKEGNTSTLTHRIEFFPDTVESRNIVDRLKKAFLGGLINRVTWPLLPHRQNPYLSYPDFASIFSKALDSLGVSKISNYLRATSPGEKIAPPSPILLTSTKGEKGEKKMTGMSCSE